MKHKIFDNNNIIEIYLAKIFIDLNNFLLFRIFPNLQLH
jgi:hypothetical protein